MRPRLTTTTAHRRRRVRADDRGFTLLEMVLVVTVLAFLYGMGAVVLYEVQRPRESRAIMDQRTLAYGIYGRAPNEHGYLADLGELPIPGAGESLNQYLTRPPDPPPTYDIRENFITVGWHGPYGSFDSSSVNRDPWGNPWIIHPDGRIQSLGKDGINSADDLIFPDYAPLPRNTVVGSLAVIVVDPETGERITDDSLVTVIVSNHPDDVEAIFEPSMNGFVADDLTPGRKRIDVEGQGALLGANAFTEVLLPIGGVTSITLPLRRDILPDP